MANLIKGMEKNSFEKSIPLLFLLSLFHTFSYMIVPIYLSMIGLNGLQIGILIAIHSFMTIFASFPTGFVNDTRSVRTVIISGLILMSLYFVGLGFINEFIFIIPLYFIGGLGANMIDVSVRTVAFKADTKGRDGWKFGKYQFIRVAGSGIGVISAGIIISVLDFSTALKIIGVIYALMIPLVSFDSIAAHKIKMGQYKKDILNRSVIIAGAIRLLFSTHWGAETTSYGLFLTQNLNLDMFTVGLYIAGTIIFLGLSAYFFGKRIDSGRSNMKNIFVIGMIISGVFHILHTIPILEISFIFRAIHEIGDGMAIIAMFFWISKLFGKERIGGNSSFMFTLTLIGHVVGSLIYGPIGDYMGYHMPLIFSGITNIMCAILLVIFVRMYKIKETY